MHSDCIVAQMKSLVSTAREFCNWCKTDPASAHEEGQRAHTLLARLYARALELEAPAQYDSDVEPKRIGDEEWKAVFKRGAALPFQYYSSYFDPSVIPPDEHEIGDLSDDIADIYRDLSAALALYDDGHETEAQREFHFSFVTHWGRHASGAIRALHCWYVDGYEF
jgi:hypothetical protein